MLLKTQSKSYRSQPHQKTIQYQAICSQCYQPVWAANYDSGDFSQTLVVFLCGPKRHKHCHCRAHSQSKTPSADKVQSNRCTWQDSLANISADMNTHGAFTDYSRYIGHHYIVSRSSCRLATFYPEIMWGGSTFSSAL